jgi:hypothetical protein
MKSFAKSQLGGLVAGGGVIGGGLGGVNAALKGDSLLGGAATGALVGAGALGALGLLGTTKVGKKFRRDAAGFRYGFNRGKLAKLAKIMNKRFEMKPGVEFGVRDSMLGLIGVNSGRAAKELKEVAKIDRRQANFWSKQARAKEAAYVQSRKMTDMVGAAGDGMMASGSRVQARRTFREARMWSKLGRAQATRAAAVGALPVVAGGSYLAGKRKREGVAMSALRPGMVEFEFVDARPRNDMGQYMANETGGADPNSMQAAYGNVEAEKQARRRSLVQRLKAMIAG